MRNFIIRLVSVLGRFLGVIIQKTNRFLCDCKKAFCFNFNTSRQKNSFGSFGKGSILYGHLTTENPQNIFIGENAIVQKHCMLESWHFPYMETKGELRIGDNCNIGEFSHITTINKIVIGNNSSIGRFVLITDNTHGKTDGEGLDSHPLDREILSKGPVIIGKNVWLADKVSVMPGVTIGDGVIVAANAVVTHDIPPYSIAAGNPAKVVKRMRNVEE